MVFKKLPRKIKIKRKIFSVEYKDQISDGKYAGTVVFEDRLISIATQNTNRQEIDSTILHEVLHAIANEYKFTLSESMVLKLEKGLIATFLKNGWKIVKD